MNLKNAEKLLSNQINYDKGFREGYAQAKKDAEPMVEAISNIAREAPDGLTRFYAEQTLRKYMKGEKGKEEKGNGNSN